MVDEAPVETHIEVHIPDEQKKKNRRRRLLTVIFLGIALVILGIVLTATKISPITILIIAIIIFVFAGIIFFISNIKNIFSRMFGVKEDKKEGDTEKLPVPKTVEDLFAVVKTQIELPMKLGGFENHIKAVGRRIVKWEGQNQIVHFRIIPLYTDDGIQFIDFIFNSNFSNGFTVDYDITDAKLSSLMRQISQTPSEIPLKEKFHVINPMTGNESFYEKTKPKEKQENKPEKKFE